MVPPRGLTNILDGDACSDSLYVALQKRDSSSYTPAEKKHYLYMKDLCNDQKPTDYGKVDLGQTLMWTGIIFVGISAIIYLVISQQAKQ